MNIMTVLTKMILTNFFFRFAPCDSNDDSDIEYETLDFSIMSNINDDNTVLSGMD